MKLVNQIIIVTLIVLLLTAVVTLLMPEPVGWQGGRTIFHLPLAASLPLMYFHIAAAIIFTLGVGVYKKRFQQACLILVGAFYLKSAYFFFRADEY